MVTRMLVALTVFLSCATEAFCSPSGIVFLNICVNSSDVKKGNIDTWTKEARTFDRAIQDNLGSTYTIQTRRHYGADASLACIHRAFKWVNNVAEADSLVIVYLGAHGGYSKTSGYFASVADGYLHGREIKKALGSLPCQLILIVDSCNAGGILLDWGEVNDKTIIFATSQVGTSAYCWGWTPHFIKALTDADYNEDGTVDVDEMRRYIDKHITNQKQCVSRMSFSVVLVKFDDPELAYEYEYNTRSSTESRWLPAREYPNPFEQYPKFTRFEACLVRKTPRIQRVRLPS